MADNFLYNPNSNYGYRPSPGPWGRAKSYLDTYAGGMDAELNPEAYFTHVAASQGYGGLNAKGNEARNLYGRLWDAYGAARLKNNELTWKSFVDPLQFKDILGQMSYSDRGINTSNVAPGDVRWIPR